MVVSVPVVRCRIDSIAASTLGTIILPIYSTTSRNNLSVAGL